MAKTERSPRSVTELAAAFRDWTAERPAPAAIRSATFPTVRKGFDPSEVTAYLARVAAGMERLQDRIEQLEAERAEATTFTPAPAAASAAVIGYRFREPAAHIADLIRRFEENVRLMKVEAETEVKSVLVAARAEADEIRGQARLERENAVADAAAIVAQTQADAQRMQQEAQTRADDILRSATSNRQTMIDDLAQMREELVMTLARLDAVLAEREDADRLIVVDETHSARTI